MPRTLRPHLPGVAFHTTARIQCREPLLLGLEELLASMILEALWRSDARLVAYAIMPNHLHVIVQQGLRPLSHYMQPLLRRIALLVRRSHEWEGHVFERRYRESACMTADYLRNAIAYVHLNGPRASLASSPDAYRWCSSELFCRNEYTHPASRAAVCDALRLFAPAVTSSLTECRDNYRAFVRWRTLKDAYDASGQGAGSPPELPVVSGGDVHWDVTYAPYVRSEAENNQRAPKRMDLRDLAISAMRECDPAMDLDDLRLGGSTRAVVRVRKHVIIRAKAAGHTGRAIARFLGVSAVTVSLARP